VKELRGCREQQEQDVFLHAIGDLNKDLLRKESQEVAREEAA
jgi:hypothetical protein